MFSLERATKKYVFVTFYDTNEKLFFEMPYMYIHVHVRGYIFLSNREGYKENIGLRS